jgi:hypothetical protein
VNTNSAVVTLSAALGFAVARQIRPDSPAFRVLRLPEKKLERFLPPAGISLNRLAIARP